MEKGEPLYNASCPSELTRMRYEKQIATYFKPESLNETQAIDLKNFKTEFCEQRKQKIATQDSYLRYVCFFGRFTKKNYREATRQDIENYLSSLKQKSESLQDWAKLSLKLFYRWLLTKRTEKGSPFPEIVSWIKVRKNTLGKVKPEDCITQDEYKRMLKACKTQRDRALIAVLYDSGLRISELVNVFLKDVNLEDELPYLNINDSKTENGKRAVYLMDSLGELRTWLEMHPKKKEKSSLLFVGLKNSAYSFVEPRSALQIVKRIAKRAGLTKNIYCHLFRHTSATEDRKLGMPDQFMNTQFGWTEKSRMSSRYAHTTGKDVARWKRKALGLPVADDKNTKQPKKCPRCSASNSWDSEYCKICTTPLDAKLAVTKQTIDSKRLTDVEKQLKLITELLKKKGKR